jgi:hypothetical protein
MYAGYKSHDDVTLSSMEDALCRLHAFKDVFLLGQAGINAEAKANALGMGLVTKRMVAQETNVETWTASKKWGETNAWRDYIIYEIDVSKELDGDFNFPMIDLISHWVEQIHQYRALEQDFAEIHEQAHKTSPKYGAMPPIRISLPAANNHLSASRSQLRN